MSSTTSAVESATSSAADGSISAGGGNLKIVGIILAVVSGLLIGSSFVFKKKGLLQSQEGGAAGEGVAYLKSWLWWLGMIMMILGEICNFAAYAFVEAIVVTPLGALSVVVCAILSSIFLNEKLSFFGWLGCALCIMGSVVIALNGPKEESVGKIREFQKLFIAPGFLTWIGVLITASIVIVIFFAPKYGKDSMFWYIMVCSMIGGISVSVTTGLGASIVTTAKGENQFNHWFMYFLIIFVIVTLLTEVYYLNMALALFNTAMVTPTYYVIFTFFTMVTTIVLFQGLKASPTQIITIVLAFFIICVGITILQMSKVDPAQLSKLDRRSTMLLQASKQNTEGVDEKDIGAVEDPGMDTLRGSFGAIGSVIRARSAKRMSQSSRTTSYRSRMQDGEWGPARHHLSSEEDDPRLAGMKRHQLWDAPVPARVPSVQGSPLQHRTTIKFDDHDVVHKYAPPGSGETAFHTQQRSNSNMNSSTLRGMPYPPPPAESGSRIDTNVSPAGTPGDDSPYSNPFSPVDYDPFATVNQSRMPQTAPPTSHPDKLQMDLGEMGARNQNLYANSPSTSTLLTFPSVTDSARSSGSPYNTPLAERWRTESTASTATGGKKKTYPKLKDAKADDVEESVGLWRRDVDKDSDDDYSERPSQDDYVSSPLEGGGIRLVTNSSSNRF